MSQPIVIADKVLAALSKDEPRGTAELCRRTGLTRKCITSALFRLKTIGVVANAPKAVGAPNGNNSARFVLTGMDRTRRAHNVSPGFTMPEELPDWLTMPVYRPTGEVRRVVWE